MFHSGHRDGWYRGTVDLHEGHLSRRLGSHLWFEPVLCYSELTISQLNQPITTTLSNVTVTFNGIAAALSYVSPTQVNALVPSTCRWGRFRGS